MAKLLLFPDFSVGRLYVDDAQMGLRFFGEARGQVSIGSDQLITLRISPQIEHLDWIRALEPSALNCLDCRTGSFSGRQLTNIGHLAELKSIVLSHCKLNDDDLMVLDSLNSLRTLKLDWTRITDTGLKHIRSLKSLQVLDLSRTEISDRSFESISQLSEISHLALWDCKIDGQCLSELWRLQKLSHLWLSRTRVTDASSANFSGIRHLEFLALAETKAGDQIVSQVSTLPIAELDLRQTNVSNKSMQALCSMESLQRLNLTETRFTSECAAELRSMRPEMHVSFAPRSLGTKIPQ